MQAVINGETRANTLTAYIFQVIIVVVAAFNLKTDQLDAVNTFLNNPLEEEEWVQIPSGMAIQGKVWCLFKALYGFHTSPLDMRYPPGKLPQPKPNPALGRLGWPHLIPITQWVG